MEIGDVGEGLKEEALRWMVARIGARGTGAGIVVARRCRIDLDISMS